MDLQRSTKWSTLNFNLDGTSVPGLMVPTKLYLDRRGIFKKNFLYQMVMASLKKYIHVCIPDVMVYKQVRLINYQDLLW